VCVLSVSSSVSVVVSSSSLSVKAVAGESDATNRNINASRSTFETLCLFIIIHKKVLNFSFNNDNFETLHKTTKMTPLYCSNTD